MGLSFRKRINLGNGTVVNLIKSGISVSQKIGKNITVNSKRGVTVKVAKGISYKVPKSKKK